MTDDKDKEPLEILKAMKEAIEGFRDDLKTARDDATAKVEEKSKQAPPKPGWSSRWFGQ